MKIIKGKYNELISNDKLTIAIGNFDGVHLGHQKLLRAARSYPDTKSAVMTFDPHPMTFFRKKDFYYLSTCLDKTSIFNEFDLDYCFLIDFDLEFANLSKGDFINFLKKLNVKRIILGADFSFAKHGSGNVLDLVSEFEVITLPYEIYLNERVSSSYIRDIISIGQVEKARKMLGRYYMISGKVIKGNQIGRKLGFKTANIDYGQYLLPKNGVYSCFVKVDGKKYLGMVNIGNNPTVNFSSIKKMEVHIIDFEANIYGYVADIEFVSFIRSEKKFSNKEELILELGNNKEEIGKSLKLIKEENK
ncbi:bifunctional riboflavin kinase/FAD synthetase [Acholeplasma sp. OttesenSCG-928-E16]|nr:bifunctional riboflavin kinase/FAD synthetase [Acholeplasma sp. OttesenSCG-928-E16]